MASPLFWELDFYSRPVLDENDKKIWELLICNPDRSFCHVKQCPSDQVNSGWLATELANLTSTTGVTPLKIRFFRNSMANIISRGCKQAGLVAQSSRRLFALEAWLRQRMAEVYPQYPKFQAPEPTPLPLTPPAQLVPQPLPDALTADRWQPLTLPAQELDNAAEWELDFGELFPVNLAPDTPIPGIMMNSVRAVAISAWMSGVDPLFLRFYPTIEGMQLRLDAGADSSWIVGDVPDQTLAQEFETAKQKAEGIHFLALQSDAASDRLAGFWLLKQV